MAAIRLPSLYFVTYSIKKQGIMKRFLIIYHAPKEAMAQTMNVTPEQAAKGMAVWQQWVQRTGSNLVDMGAPLFNSQALNAQGETSESSKNVSGFSIIQAEDMEAAKAIMAGHPHISGWHPESTIEIHETMQLPGM